MAILDFFMGTHKFEFLLKDRTKVYQIIYSLEIRIISVKLKGDSVLLRVSNIDAKKLLRALKSENDIVWQETGVGLPSLLRKLTFRSGLVLGFALGVGLLLFCRSRVWEIDVVGSTAIDPDLFFEELATCGLHEGMSFHDLNAEEVAFAMQKLDRRIAWMQIRREGVRMIVDWIPTNDSILPLQPPKDRGSNLIASADAVIVDMLIQKGVPTVSIGEVVRKGELLVSGIKQNSAIYAQGRVIGQIKESVRVTVPIVQTVIRESNTEAIGLEVNLFGHRLCFGESEGSYEESGRLYLFDRIRIPVRWKKIYRCDYDCSERELSEKEAAQLAMRRLSETLEIKLKDGELLSSQVSGGFTDDGYTISADIEYLINIAKTLEFSIENE